LFKKIKISKAFLEHLKWVAFVYYEKSWFKKYFKKQTIMRL